MDTLTLKAADHVVSQARQLVTSADQEADTDPTDRWHRKGSPCQKLHTELGLESFGAGVKSWGDHVWSVHGLCCAHGRLACSQHELGRRT